MLNLSWKIFIYFSKVLEKSFDSEFFKIFYIRNEIRLHENFAVDSSKKRIAKIVSARHRIESSTWINFRLNSRFYLMNNSSTQSLYALYSYSLH